MNISDIVYFVSDEFDYSRVITIGEVGPSYAEMMGWKYDSLSNMDSHRGKVKVIDPRITAKECDAIQCYAQKSVDPFVFCFIDPYKERSHPFFQLVHQFRKHPNILMTSKYQPEEMLFDLVLSVGEKKMLILNYPYLQRREREIDFRSRKNKLMFSGRVSKQIYPERFSFLNKMMRSPLRLKIDFLTHPGYIDVGQKRKHDVVGEKYVDLLSKYTLMFTSSSRCRLEFLKFSECAYAGCVPVGTSPKTFHPEMKAPFLELNYERLTWTTFCSLMKNRKELYDRAFEYRNAFRKWRNPDYLNGLLLEFLDNSIR